MLLDNGADVNLINTESESSSCDTALSYACRNGFVALAELLLDNGADISCVNFDGDTPLILVINSRPTSALVPLLLKRGADASIVNEEGLTALDYVAEDSEIAQLIANSQLENILK